jgi:hypothetical protein
MTKQRYDIGLINAIADAAEKEGGLSKINFVGRRRSWHRCVSYGYLWYNVNGSNTTRLQRIGKMA